ncbi:MAG: hypothetical protein Q7V57_08915 [Actinomycetota bacterium]|nr:hypothetical protein [Actinomycetota bacterium]
MSREGRVSGRVELRPVRLGLVVEPNSHQSLRRAVEFASACWGGRTFPIFEADEDPRSVREACTALGVDAVVSCEEAQTEVNLAAMEGFRWMGLRSSPIVLGEHSDRLVDLRTVSSAVLRSGRPTAGVQLVKWDDSDPLSPLLRVLYGQIGANTTYERGIATSIGETFATIEIGLGEALPIDRGRFGPLAVGMWRVHHQSATREAGAAIVNADMPHDLVRLWNLRAIGHLVIPWADPPDPRIEEYARAHLAIAPVPEWGGEPGFLCAFSPTRDAPDSLMELLRATATEGRTVISWLDLQPHVHLSAPIQTDLTSVFDVSAEAVAGRPPSIRIPLPRTDLVPDQRGMDGWQYGAFRVTIHSERDIGERVSFRGPGVRPLSPALRWAASTSSPMVRGVGDGIVLAAKVDEDHLALSAIDSFMIIDRLLTAAGFKARIGDAGRWSGRIVDLLGGAGSSLACQPAVREVLDLAARPRGGNPHELRSAAARHKGMWADPSVFWRRGVDYETWVVGALAAQRIIESALSYTCPTCGLPQTITAERVGPTLRCNDCEAETPLSLQIVNGAGWRLRTRQLIDQRRLRSTLPVAASLRMLLDLCRDSDTLHYALGVVLEIDGQTFEIDFVAFVNDDRGACLVVGEGKARNSLEEADISNLEVVQEAIRALGVECFIAIASSKDKLDRDEVLRLRAAADRFLFGIQPSRGQGSYTNMPLVLTKGSLTVPSQNELHPIRATGGFRRDVAALAHWTCERELGLDGYGDWTTRTLNWKPIDAHPAGSDPPDPEPPVEVR